MPEMNMILYWNLVTLLLSSSVKAPAPEEVAVVMPTVSTTVMNGGDVQMNARSLAVDGSRPRPLRPWRHVHSFAGAPSLWESHGAAATSDCGSALEATVDT